MVAENRRCSRCSPVWFFRSAEFIAVDSIHYLTANRNLNSLSMYQGGDVVTHWLTTGQPYKLTIGSGGIQIYASYNPVHISGNGVLTSSQSFLDVRLNANEGFIDPFYINSVISDNGNRRVGLRIRGIRHNGWVATVLGGDKSNTFTGTTEVSGEYNVVSLNKTNGAIAIKGDIFINNHAKLTLWRDGQIASTSTVRLRDSTFQFANERYDGKVIKKESFHKLVIEGESFLQFDPGVLLDQRFLYLNNLSIANGGKLVVQGWREGLHWFLVRKTSANLEDALKKIAFEGYLPGRTHLEDYNRDYWAISGTPEPSVYGAVLGSVGVGLFAWRKKRRGAPVFDCDSLTLGQSSYAPNRPLF